MYYGLNHAYHHTYTSPLIIKSTCKFLHLCYNILTCLLGLCSGLTMSPGSDTLLVESPLRLNRLFTVGGFSSTASIISGIIGAELERFILLSGKWARESWGPATPPVLVWAGQLANVYKRGVGYFVTAGSGGTHQCTVWRMYDILSRVEVGT
jgi:hypothetical protein